MRKTATDIKSPVSPDRPGSRLLTLAMIVSIGVVATPVVIECAKLYYSKWSAVMGKSADSRTPILDSISATSLTAYHEICLFFSPVFGRLINDQGVLLPVAVITIGIGMFVLRKSGHYSG